jgi:short-subunit dehydrogenase
MVRAMSEQRRTALVTGASSGIGAALARKLGAREYDCVLSARRVDRLEALARELEKTNGVRAHVVAADLGEHGGAEKLIQSVAGLGLSVDVLINNAGFGVYGPFVDQPASRVMQMVELNLVSLTRLTHHYAGEMAGRKRGRILQVASIGAYQPSPLYAVYSATKTYVLFFSEAINYELRGTGVSVTTMSPGLTATEFHEVAAHKKPKWMNLITMTADDVAEVGLRSMMKGRSVVTPGFANKLTALIVKLLPRSWATSMAALSMRGGAAS